VVDWESAQPDGLKCLEMLQLEGAHLVGRVLDFTIGEGPGADQCTGVPTRVAPQGRERTNCTSKCCWVISEYQKRREKRCTILCLYNYSTGSVVSKVWGLCTRTASVGVGLGLLWCGGGVKESREAA